MCSKISSTYSPDNCRSGKCLISDQEALLLIDETDLDSLCERASEIRDQNFGSIVTYSPKVFVPLTQLCRDVCHYCTFATSPSKIKQAYLSPEQVLDIAKQGVEAGCCEILFTLGDKPELRYAVARGELAR